MVVVPRVSPLVWWEPAKRGVYGKDEELREVLSDFPGGGHKYNRIVSKVSIKTSENMEE